MQLILVLIVATASSCREWGPRPTARARGNEPFWAVDAGDSTLVYRTPDLPDGRTYRIVNFEESSTTRSWYGSLDEQSIVLRLEHTACVDTMSGQEFAWSASAEVHGVTLKGCGESS